MCIASSSSKNRIIQCLKLTDQLKFFDRKSIFTFEQVLKDKPAPDIFLYAAKNMRFSSENCIVFEDSPHGIEAAKLANMQVIGFLGGTHAMYKKYRKKIKSYKIPITKTNKQLLKKLKKYLNI